MILCAALTVAFVSRTAPAQQSLVSLEPHILRAGDTEIGVVYTPELLASLLASEQRKSVDATVTQAISEQTPIVVMWKAPLPPDVPALQLQWMVTIVEGRGDPVNPNRSDPLWIRTDPRFLAGFDDRLARRDVAAIAAFPRAAFVLGRVVFLYAKFPPDYERHVVRSIRRSARIDWDGSRPDSRAAREPRF